MATMEITKTDLYNMLSMAVLAQMHNELTAQAHAAVGMRQAAIRHQLYLIQSTINIKQGAHQKPATIS